MVQGEGDGAEKLAMRTIGEAVEAAPGGLDQSGLLEVGLRPADAVAHDWCSAALIDLTVTDNKVDRFVDNTTVRITLREGPEILETCASGLIFALRVLSLHDGRPRGNSEMDYEPREE